MDSPKYSFWQKLPNFWAGLKNLANSLNAVWSKCKNEAVDSFANMSNEHILNYIIVLTLKDAGVVESTLRSGDWLSFLKEWSKCSQTSWLFQEWCWAQGKGVILGISWMTVQKMDRVRQKFQKILRRKS